MSDPGSSRYIQRVAEQEQIIAEAEIVRATSRSRAVFVYGRGGMGKTRLLRQLEHVIRDPNIKCLAPIDVDDSQHWLLSNLERYVADRLDQPILEHFAGMRELPRALMLRRAARAATYLLTVTAQPRINGRKDLSEELLEKLASHPDPITRKLSRWALSFRWDDDNNGAIRPFIASAEHGEKVDDPY